jgi:hypothetical protein
VKLVKVAAIPVLTLLIVLVAAPAQAGDFKCTCALMADDSGASQGSRTFWIDAFVKPKAIYDANKVCERKTANVDCKCTCREQKKPKGKDFDS